MLQHWVNKIDNIRDVVINENIVISYDKWFLVDTINVNTFSAGKCFYQNQVNFK